MDRMSIIVIERMLLRKVTCVPADREVTDEELVSLLDAQDTAIFVDNVSKSIDNTFHQICHFIFDLSSLLYYTSQFQISGASYI